jgi:hypothetical protein
MTEKLKYKAGTEVVFKITSTSGEFDGTIMFARATKKLPEGVDFQYHYFVVHDGGNVPWKKVRSYQISHLKQDETIFNGMSDINDDLVGSWILEEFIISVNGHKVNEEKQTNTDNVILNSVSDLGKFLSGDDKYHHILPRDTNSPFEFI